MKLLALDGAEITIEVKPSKYGRKANASQAHCRVGDIINEIYYGQNILEEFPIPRGRGLKLDFFIPDIMLVIEVDGIQHDKFVKHFHGTIEGFRRAKSNDRRKRNWCENNGIQIIRIPDSYSEKEIREMINDTDHM